MSSSSSSSNTSKIEEGLLFPPGEKNDRSTTFAGKEAFAAAFAGVKNSDDLVANARNEKNWRFGYAKHCVKLVEVAAKSPANAVAIARGGLDWMHRNFEFVRDGKTYKFNEAMANIQGVPFNTHTVVGRKEKPANLEIEVPYKGKILKGQDLCEQIDRWARYGTIEPSCAANMKAAVQRKEWLDLSSKYFVLLGAGSAMGPFLLLMSFGANIIAIDLNRANIWKRLISIAEDSFGTMTFPMRVSAAGLSNDDICNNAGCNLFTQTPEIMRWIVETVPDKQLIIGGYAYLDGELHVRVSLAMDAIIKGVCEQRPDTAVAYLNTPTQCFIIPDEARKESEKNYNAWSLINIFLTPVRILSFGKYLKKNGRKPITADDGKSYSICDGLVIAQGPNYCLAKTLQHWRAVLLKSEGFTVSSNVAPSTATASVVSNKSFGWAYGGFHHFKPMEVFQQETSNAVMGALLIHDVSNPAAVSNPSTKLDNPWLLFSNGAFHGGVWRNGYTINSIGEVAALLYFFDQAKPFLLLLTFLIILYFIYLF